MLSIEDALEQIVKSVVPLPEVEVFLTDARGLVLAADAYADIDSPPFDKSMMDGFAVHAETVSFGSERLTVLETVMAGELPTQPVKQGFAIQIMTGAPIPEGTTAVVPIEQTEFDSTAMQVQIKHPVQPGKHLLRRGENTTVGDVVVKAGMQLDASAIGALAEFGHATVTAFRRPRVAVLTTGDELVPISEKPGPGQIRNSNAAMLSAQIERAGAVPVLLGVASDHQTDLRNRIEQGLQCDMLVLSGGVSAGKKDLVPAELQNVGVKQVFHKIRMKPGKPLWFGVKNQLLKKPHLATAGKTNQPCPVFGLPGNPVSSMVCFELFVRTALRRQLGMQNCLPMSFDAQLRTPYQFRGDRPVHHPAQWKWESGNAAVQLVSWKGSSDLRSTVDANCTVLFTPDQKEYQNGETVSVFPWNESV